MKRVDEENRIQAEIAGGSFASPNQAPAPGQCLRPFSLRSAQGRLLGLPDFRDRSAVVLILSDGTPEAEALIRDSARHYDEIQRQNAEVLAILCDPQEVSIAERRLATPFPVLLDEDGKLHRELGAVDEQGHCAAAVCVIDRFGEVFALYRTAGVDVLPDLAEILRRIEFIGFQCPECEPPEWPA